MTLHQESLAVVPNSDEQDSEEAPLSAADRRYRWRVYVGRTVVLVGFLLGWHFLPQIEWLSERFRFLDPFFVSSPERVVSGVINFAIGGDGRPLIWPYLGQTLSSGLIGLAIGGTFGILLGLVLGSIRYLHDVLVTFVQAVNSIPNIALIPIVIALVGIGAGSEVTISSLSVFFVVFFNCLEGSLRVPHQVLDNATVLGASRLQTMRHVQVRYVLLWAFASIPNAMAHCILSVIMMQILAGTGGIGLLMLIATSAIDTTTNLALIVYLTLTVVALVKLGEIVKRRLLFWA
jgi:NitT/TauT family transport system permease protein